MIIPDMEYIPLETMVVALELISCLQKIAQQRYLPRQYRAIGEVRRFKQTHLQTYHEWPVMGLFIMHSKTIWTYYEIWVQFWFLRMFGPRPNGPEAIPRTSTFY